MGLFRSSAGPGYLSRLVRSIRACLVAGLEPIANNAAPSSGDQERRHGRQSARPQTKQIATGLQTLRSRHEDTGLPKNLLLTTTLQSPRSLCRTLIDQANRPQ